MRRSKALRSVYEEGKEPGQVCISKRSNTVCGFTEVWRAAVDSLRSPVGTETDYGGSYIEELEARIRSLESANAPTSIELMEGFNGNNGDSTILRVRPSLVPAHFILGHQGLYSVIVH
jgi:hypothetical protein